MSNTVTDQLGIVATTYAWGFLQFTYQIKALADCDQVVFREESMIGLSDSQGEHHIKVRKGDKIIRVYHKTCIYQLVGTMRTKDNYIRAYELPIGITASDSSALAESYIRGEDPIGRAIHMVKVAFENFIRDIEYEKLALIKLRWGDWSERYLPSLGIHIEQHDKPKIREDPFRIELYHLDHTWRNQKIKLRREQEIRRLQDEIKGERDRLLQEEEYRAQAKQREFDRQEKTKDQLYEISASLRKVAAEEITRVLKERIYEGFARGHNPGEISHEYFSVVGIFQRHSKHTELDQSIIEAGSFVDGSVNQRTENTSQPLEHPDYSAPEDSY